MIIEQPVSAWFTVTSARFSPAALTDPVARPGLGSMTLLHSARNDKLLAVTSTNIETSFINNNAVPLHQKRLG